MELSCRPVCREHGLGWLQPLPVTGEVAGGELGDAVVLTTLLFEKGVVLLQVNSTVDMKRLAQPGECCLESEDAVIRLVPSAQDQSLLARCTRPLNRLPDQSVGRPQHLEAGVRSSEKGKHVHGIMQVKRGGDNLVLVFSKDKSGALGQFVSHCTEETVGEMILRQSVSGYHCPGVDSQKLSDIVVRRP